MAQFIQAYSVWILMGIVLLGSLLFFARSRGYRSHTGQEPGGQNQRTGTPPRRDWEGDGRPPDSGGCCG